MRRRSSTLRVKSLKAALHEFLSAPATGGYGINDGVVQRIMGSKGTQIHDCPTFDNVRDKYEKPKACTFEAAFNACWHGSRDWHDFDLAALQDSHEEFRHLQLPERVQDVLEREAIAGEHAEQAAANEEPAEEFPPLELLRRGGPRRRDRQAVRRKPGRAPSVRDLQRQYKAAKRAYHVTGEQLHWHKLRGHLL